MSIILKGIDLPTDRKPYAIEVTYRFEGADGLFSEEIFLSPNQAIQIPRGHGRLIDASTETTVKSMSGKAMDVGMLLIALKQYVPTIFGEEE